MMRTPVALLIGLVACVSEDPVTSTSTDEIDLDLCEIMPYMCNNSPGYLHYGMHELSLLGEPNRQHVRIRRGPNGLPVITMGTTDYRFDIVDGQMIARGSTGQPVLVGDQLVGAVLQLEDARTDTRIFDIHIRNYRLTKYQIKPTTPLHLYVLLWQEPDLAPNPKLNACNPYPWPPDKPRADLFMGMEKGETLVFLEDRIDPVRLTLDPNPANAVGWATFGCAGHAFAKLDLSGNTRHRQPIDDWETSQATLKLYTADVCGDGFPFTRPDTPVVWRTPTQPYFGPAAGLEARWTSQGASCLAMPRMAAHPAPPFLDIYSQINQRCGSTLDWCSNLDIHAFEGTRRITANYFP